MKYIESFNENTSAVGGAGGSVQSVPSGMGVIQSGQPSALPGALNGVDWINGGGRDGSGDISVAYNPTGANRVYQKVPSPMGKSHGSRTGKKNRKLSTKRLREILKGKKRDKVGGSGIKKVMNFDSFTKSQLNDVEKVDV